MFACALQSRKVSLPEGGDDSLHARCRRLLSCLTWLLFADWLCHLSGLRCFRLVPIGKQIKRVLLQSKVSQAAGTNSLGTGTGKTRATDLVWWWCHVWASFESGKAVLEARRPGVLSLVVPQVTGLASAIGSKCPRVKWI